MFGKDCAATPRSPTFGSNGFCGTGVEMPPVEEKISLALSIALLQVYSTPAVMPWKFCTSMRFCSPLYFDQAPLLRWRTRPKLQSTRPNPGAPTVLHAVTPAGTTEAGSAVTKGLA